ncbi:DUF2612 domain-containing protein [Pseudomonas sp. 10C3]|uniref:DUF2612 domain-containing protein n=1 Tax=Pseudomonas sp. 10C3 TaxID=3118753 RepID=UPI002E823741|nr:DUF2612 domain-containing protein [Pseudomonas sp. 10C3]MEE3504824.1 DUF2612 domain-containing protein [Pseudomonas sp. 10C3]
MIDISNYTAKITSEHSDKPKFMFMVTAVAQAFVDVSAVSDGLPDDFDLDNAVGVQIDVIGLWVGVGRNISTPLTSVYFSLDTAGLGFDQGSWKGPFDPANGITTLDDETYKTLIRAKIGANRWDGTLEQSKEIMDLVFSGDSLVFIQDNQDMTITIGVAGKAPSAIELALLTGGYIPIKPQSVHVNYYIAPTADGPLFGFDASTQYVSGFDQGSWGQIY